MAPTKRTAADALLDQENLGNSNTRPSSTASTTTKDCDAIRHDIRAFIDSKQMKVGEFQRAIGVSSRSYNDFLNQVGPEKGSRSATYLNAMRFFANRGAESMPLADASASAANIALPAATATAAAATAKRARKETANTASRSGSGSRAAAAAAADANSKFDVSGIVLEGENEMKVPVFETCDRIRKKIRAHVKKQGVTKSGFLKDAAKAAMPGSEKKINPGSLDTFLKYDGALTGNSGIVFYAAYVFFEKLRIKEGKPKDDFRLTMEKIWPAGVDRERSSNGPFFCHVSERPYINEFGQLEIISNSRVRKFR
ncbi:uncharacterized protein BO97DRAFT_408239 [Aspergillus homomorphus CBS 101889]|uniref:DUF7726 domain-containing protein n=1 Tax=Aspergillus homomorphus (strain CBS 101889) TaxID=1450537 RepID=A0A395HLA7_ASPHC|nr:hypothetical protein BO97DRAFT_408239 [Aspergillus homomorphus CBS 101889]RAL08550.1 hypothetical protein BO97DRAFT_408239 [Aspergillus homomorphus CBS 101889]